MARKLKSGIVGQAQVIFGGAIGMSLGTVKYAGEEVLAVGMAELKHPAAKAGDPIIDEETYNGIQVSLVFPDFEALNNFRHILDKVDDDLLRAAIGIITCEYKLTSKHFGHDGTI